MTATTDQPPRTLASRPGALVRLERDADVAWLTLDRPDRLNAFNVAMHADLAEALTLIERSPPASSCWPGRDAASARGRT